MEITKTTYINICYLLLALTGLTLVQPYIISLNLSGTLGIQLILAFTKAALVVAYYMHVKTESSLYKWIIFFALSILIFVFSIVAIDTYYRASPEHDLFNRQGIN